MQEIGSTIAWSFVGWAIVFVWRGRDLLPTILSSEGPVADRTDAFAELASLAILMGVALALIARLGAASVRLYVTRDDPDSLVARGRAEGFLRASRKRAARRFRHELRNSSVPGAAWDRLLARLNNQREAVLCRVKTNDGEEVLGVLADEAYADWGADGRDLLLMPEVIDDGAGNLRPLESSRGVFVAGSQITSLSVVHLPTGALLLDDDG